MKEPHSGSTVVMHKAHDEEERNKAHADQDCVAIAGAVILVDRMRKTDDD